MKRPGLLVVSLVLALAPSAWAAPPDWVGGRSKKFPEGFYFTGVGRGDNGRAAEDAAYAAVAKIFSVNVQQQTRDLDRLMEVQAKGKSETARRLEIEQLTRTSTDRVLEGVEIAERWEDPATKVHFALAALDRQQAEARLSEKTRLLDREVAEDLSAARDEKGEKLARLRAYRRAASALASRAALSSDLQIVSIKPLALDPPISSAVLASEMEKFISSSLAIRVEVGGPQGEMLAKAVAEALNRQGLPVSQGKEADLLIRGEAAVWDADIPDPKIKFARWCADFQLIDMKNDAVYASIARSGREGHLSASEARNRALRAMQPEVIEELSGKIGAFLSGDPPSPISGAACPREK